MLFLQQNEVNLKKYSEILSETELFRDIKKEDISSLLNCLCPIIKKFKPSSYIFHEGDTHTPVGIILKGNVQIVYDDFSGNRHIINSLSEKNMFGESFACSSAENITVSAIATDESEIMLFDFKKILTTCNNSCLFHNALIFNMLRAVSQKNVFLSEKINIISKRTTREKLLTFLSYQSKKNNSSEFTIEFSRQELADFLCVDRSAMSSELSKMKTDGIIDYNKNHFILL